MKVSNWQENIAVVNIYLLNIKAPRFAKKIMNIKGQVDGNKVNNGDFITLPSATHRSSSKKISKETVNLNYIADQIDLAAYST